MKIVFRHKGILPVEKYGGTERIIFWLMKALVKKGFKVCLIGNTASKVSSIGVELVPELEEDWRIHIPDDADLLHLFEPFRSNIDVPYIITIGGNGQLGEYYDLNTVFVSKKHANNHASDSYVYNGLDLEEYPYVKKTTGLWNNFSFLAKASWNVKNLSHCVKACKKAKKNLDIAGGRIFSFSKYIKSYGMVDQNTKIQILKNSDALLFPVRWHEPFGIAIIEAMAMGIPVIGSSYGSLPEIIKKGTGYLCKDFDDLFNIVSSEKNLFDPDYIRTYVETNFSSDKMADDYISYYERVIKGDKLNKLPPTNNTGRNPQDLLPF
jgi:glycosyltransferase involved in cell wall biosynthesis